MFIFSSLFNKISDENKLDNSRPHPITQGYIQAIQQIQNNINDKFNQFKEI